MARKLRGLGIGLDVLLDERQGTAPETEQVREFRHIPLAQIERNPHQPRHCFDEDGLGELAASIKDKGVLQPILVRPLQAGVYGLIAGERRWRAAQMAGLEAIPACVRVLSDHEVLMVALIENIQREDLNVVEEAEAMNNLLSEYRLTHEQLAASLGRSRTAITNTLRLLKLPPGIHDMLKDGRLEMGHARALLGAAAEEQLQLAHRVVEGCLNVRQTERLVTEFNDQRQTPLSRPRQCEQDPDLQRLCRHLSDVWQARVQIEQPRRKNPGRMLIYYNSAEELDGILERLGQGDED